jgi:L-lactate dehydrogenase (cytochrome)
LLVTSPANAFLRLDSDIYAPVHPPTAIEDNLEKSQMLGPVDPKTIKVEQRELTDAERRRRDALANLPPVGTVLSLDEFEVRIDEPWAC